MLFGVEAQALPCLTALDRGVIRSRELWAIASSGLFVELCDLESLEASDDRNICIVFVILIIHHISMWTLASTKIAKL